MPASLMAASISARSRSGSSPGNAPQGFTERYEPGWPGSDRLGRRWRPPERGTLPCIESSEPTEYHALPSADPFGARASLGPGLPDIYRLGAVDALVAEARLPVTVRILLENLLRHAGG